MPIIQPKPTASYAIPVAPQVLYCSPAATEAGTGALNAPIKLSKVGSVVKDGAVVVLRGGVYQEELKIEKKIIVQPYPNEFPVIDGRDEITGFVQEGAYWVKNNYSVEIPKMAADERDTTKTLRSAANNQQFWINDTFLDQVETLAQLAPGKFYLQPAIANVPGKIYFSDNPTGKVVRGVKRVFGVRIASYLGSNTVIKGITIIGHGVTNVGCHAANIRIEGCAIGYSSYLNVNPATSTVIKNCLVIGAGRCNVGVGWKSSGIVIEDSTLVEGNKRNFNSAWAGANIKLAMTTRATIKNCIVGDTPKAAAIWLDETCVDCRVVDNRIRKSNIGGFNEISGKNYFENNIIEDCNVGIMSCASNGTEILGNTFRRNNIDLVVKDDSRINAHVTPNVPYTQKGLVLKNNLFEATKKTIVQAASSDGIDSASYFGEVSNNQYKRPSESVKLAMVTVGRVVKEVEQPYLSANAIAPVGSTLPPTGGPQPPMPPKYEPLTEAQHNALLGELNEAYADIADLENLLSVNQDVLKQTVTQLDALQAEAIALRLRVKELEEQVNVTDPTVAKLQARLDQIRELALQIIG